MLLTYLTSRLLVNSLWIILGGFTDVNMILENICHFVYALSGIKKKSLGGDTMATDKRQFTLRIQDQTYEKMRYLAFVERRSIAMEIETAMLSYISAYEAQHGPIQIPEPSEGE